MEENTTLINGTYRKLNLKKSPEDVRDFKLSSFLGDALPDLPEIYSSSFDLPITDQQSSDMCLAFQIAYMKSFQEGLSLSPSWIYYMAHLLDPRANNGGLYPQYAFKALKTTGIAKYSDFNVIGSFEEVAAGMNDELFIKIREYSKKYGIKNWVRLKDIESMKRGILEQEYIVLAIPVYKEFFDAQKYVGPPNLEGKMYGGHAIGAKGWNESAFEIINSWGTDWGYEGKTMLDFDYPIWEGYVALDLDPVWPEDIDGHWAEEDIKFLIKAGLMEGYEDGTFKPDAPLSRAEYAKIKRMELDK